MAGDTQSLRVQYNQSNESNPLDNYLRPNIGGSNFVSASNYIESEKTKNTCSVQSLQRINSNSNTN